MAAPLDLYEWEARPLLVFAPSSGDDRFEAQREALARNFGSLSERDMAVLLMTGGDRVSVLVGDDPEEDPSAALRQRYGIGEGDFAVVLVGKDGGEKGRWNDPVDPEEIFSLIDAMPMRRGEMRQGG